MDFADLLPARIVRSAGRGEPELPDVAVLEDERELADLAVEVCRQLGLSAGVFGTPAAYNVAFGQRRPRLVILDWRLDREVAAAVYMALRHRFGDLQIVLWTATGEGELPGMLGADPHTRVVRKSSGLVSLETALRDAIAAAPESDGVREEDDHDGRLQGPEGSASR
jgi:CheY-like chemotaxis protein